MMQERRQIHLKIPTAASAATGILTMDMVEVVVTVVLLAMVQGVAVEAVVQAMPEVMTHVVPEPVLLDTARNMAAIIRTVQESQALAGNLLCSRIQP